MTRQSRRAFLAGGASGLAALAGCANLPVVGSDDEVTYDSQRLFDLASEWSFEAPSQYPAPVPDQLAVAHQERAASLLADVPSELSFPNEVVTYRLSDMRQSVAAELADAAVGDATLESLGAWRHERGDAAEVRGAYEAAQGEASRAAFRERQETVRGRLGSFRETWAHRGHDVVEAFAVHREVERRVAAGRRYLVPEHSFPSDPQSSVFDVGRLVGEVERASGEVDDAVGLRDAYVDSSMEPQWADIASAAGNLEHATHATRRPVEPYVSRDASVDGFERDVEGTPARQLFEETNLLVRGARSRAEDALERGGYASAVGLFGWELVGLVAMSGVVDAIQAGEYGLPASTDAVVDHREAAAAAVMDAFDVEPPLVSAVVAEPAWRELVEGDQELADRRAYESAEEAPDRRDVVHAVGHYAAAEHVARAVPAVVDRVAAALRAERG